MVFCAQRNSARINKELAPAPILPGHHHKHPGYIGMRRSMDKKVIRPPSPEACHPSREKKRVKPEGSVHLRPRQNDPPTPRALSPSPAPVFYSHRCQWSAPSLSQALLALVPRAQILAEKKKVKHPASQTHAQHPPSRSTFPPSTHSPQRPHGCLDQHLPAANLDGHESREAHLV